MLSNSTNQELCWKRREKQLKLVFSKLVHVPPHAQKAQSQNHRITSKTQMARPLVTTRNASKNAKWQNHRDVARPLSLSLPTPLSTLPFRLSSLPPSLSPLPFLSSHLPPSSPPPLPLSSSPPTKVQ